MGKTRGSSGFRPESVWGPQSPGPENGQGGLWQPQNEGRAALKSIPRPNHVPGPYTARKSGLASLNPPASPPHRKCLRDGFPGTRGRATPDPTGIGDREDRESGQAGTGKADRFYRECRQAGPGVQAGFGGGADTIRGVTARTDERSRTVTLNSVRTINNNRSVVVHLRKRRRKGHADRH